MNFGEVIAALAEGKMIQRSGWNGKGMFVFMQIPSVIPMETVPKMQSLPQAVKDEFMRRNGGDRPYGIDPIEMNTIKYSCQLAIVHPDNRINGWAPSVSDVLANDWVLYASA